MNYSKGNCIVLAAIITELTIEEAEWDPMLLEFKEYFQTNFLLFVR